MKMVSKLESLEEIKDKFGFVEQREELFSIVYFDNNELLVHVATDTDAVQEYKHKFKSKPTVEKFREKVEKILTSINI